MLDRLVETLATFETELKTQSRVLTLPLHPHLMGVPHRVNSLNRMLDLLLERDDSLFVTGSQILEWYSDQEPPTSDLGALRTQARSDPPRN